MIRVADYITQALVEHGITDVFLVTGGAAMHLNDAIGRNKAINHISCHHEQACSMAAASYYRLTNRLAAVNVSAGPGDLNAISGVFGAWVESLGLIVISGQVKYETTVRSTNLPLRQLGDQEVDITKLVESITKYAVMITDPASVRYHLERAIYLARTGRPGPVWLDVPMNVQGALIDPEMLEGFHPPSAEVSAVQGHAKRVRDLLLQSERPIVFVGSGVRLAKAESNFLEFIERWRIPVVTGFNAHDLLWGDHPCFIGRQGTIGDRAGNFAAQNADVLFVIGSRLTIRQISYSWENFAPRAYKVVVDIDESELKKPTIKVDYPIHADAGDLLKTLNEMPAPAQSPMHREWLEWCQQRKTRYPVVLPEYEDDSRGINPYVFVRELFKALPENAIVVTGDGTACVTTFQAGTLKKGQRLYSDGGSAPMGFDLPGAIGACIGSGRQRIICLAGDGSIQMNLQELQTIATNALPICVFVLNNFGYLSVRLTQKNFFPDNPMGADPRTGVGIPKFSAIADAYGFTYHSARSNSELPLAIGATLDGQGPQICEVFLDPDQPFAPKTSSRRLPDGRMESAPLEDMFPFLDRDEFETNVFRKS